ncbi:NAD-dependent epimerase/dehydratase family protein [Photobacterium alginatilyticum]|uniref:NAD-dependent epimerase/dehydratase family protein n=1 Tax=Photobacterium alginatilyticum TaxID=1775171 RepID=UPI0040693F6A
MTKKILVTGSSGFLGVSVCRELVAAGYEVVEFDISHGLSILDVRQVHSSMQDCDICVHLAAVADLYEAEDEPTKCHEVNVDGTRIIAEACFQFGVRLLYASTCCAYGNNGEEISDELSPVSPTELYAESKLAGEKIIEKVGCSYHLLRLATFYGPEMRKSLATALFLEKAKLEQTIEIHGDGNQTRCYTHVDDIATGIRVIIENENASRIINVSDDTPYSVNHLVTLINQITGRKVDVEYVEDRIGQIRTSAINSDRLRKLGWKPTWTLYSGLMDCYQKLQ